ncbi:MAG: thioredoxin family protein [Promethearchaeota archaeon]
MTTEIESVNDFNKAKKSAKVTVFDFSAVWCGPCRMLTPILDDLEGKYSKAGKDVKFFKIDVDKVRDLAIEFNIHAVPSVAIFKDGNMEGDLIIGVRSPRFYEQVIDDLLK